MATGQLPQGISNDGQSLLNRLFETANRRLRDRGITLEYAAEVIDWFLDQSEWWKSPNALRSLDGDWQTLVGKPIEEMILDSRLKPGDHLRLHVAASHLALDVIPA